MSALPDSRDCWTGKEQRGVPAQSTRALNSKLFVMFLKFGFLERPVRGPIEPHTCPERGLKSVGPFWSSVVLTV